METAIILTSEAREVENVALTIPELANALRVTDTVQYVKAGELWKNIKALRDRVASSFNPIIEKAHAAHKEALAKKAEVDKPLETAQRTVKGAMEAYDREQEAVRQAEERRLREIARKIEEEKLLQEAIEAESTMKAAGMTKEEVQEETTKIIDLPAYVPPVVVPKAIPKIEGVSFREIWKVRIVNEKLLPRDMMTPDLIKLGALARALKGQFSMPGAEAYSERV